MLPGARPVKPPCIKMHCIAKAVPIKREFVQCVASKF